MSGYVDDALRRVKSLERDAKGQFQDDLRRIRKDLEDIESATRRLESELDRAKRGTAPMTMPRPESVLEGTMGQVFGGLILLGLGWFGRERLPWFKERFAKTRLAVDRWRLPKTDLQVLGFFARYDTLTAGQISSACQITVPEADKAIWRLAKLEFVEHSPVTWLGQEIPWYATGDGRALVTRRGSAKVASTR